MLRHYLPYTLTVGFCFVLFLIFVFLWPPLHYYACCLNNSGCEIVQEFSPWAAVARRVFKWCQTEDVLECGILLRGFFFSINSTWSSSSCSREFIWNHLITKRNRPGHGWCVRKHGRHRTRGSWVDEGQSYLAKNERKTWWHGGEESVARKWTTLRHEYLVLDTFTFQNGLKTKVIPWVMRNWDQKLSELQ